MGTTTTTTGTTTTLFGWCEAESGDDAVFTFHGLYQAWRDCRRRKRGSWQAQQYESRLLDHLFDTQDRLRTRRYQPATPTCFVATRPKVREIHAARFADRVVHHWLVPRLVRLYEPIFIHDLYSNRMGKGTHAAVERLQGYMRSLHTSPATSVSPAPGEPVRQPHQGPWFLQLDVHNFFNSIHKPTLFSMLQQRLRKAIRHGKISEREAQRRLRPITDGADFLGYIVRPHYTLVRRRVVGNLRERLQAIEQRLLGSGYRRNRRYPPRQQRLCLPREPREALRATLASYLGHFKHARHQRLLQQLLQEYPWLHLLFSLDPQSLQLLPLWQPPLAAIQGYKSQIAWFRRHHPHATLWVQRGREVDRFLPKIEKVVAHREESPQASGEPCSTSPPPYAVTLVIREAGLLKGGLKRRLVTKLFYQDR